MTYKILEIVTLNHEISEYGLAEGETGTIVDVYDNGSAYEVEFINSQGKTVALLTLDSSDLCPLEISPIFIWDSPVWSGIKQATTSVGTQQFSYSQL